MEELFDEPLGTVPLAYVRVSDLVREAKNQRIPHHRFKIVDAFKVMAVRWDDSTKRLSPREHSLLDRIAGPTLEAVLEGVREIDEPYRHTATLFLTEDGDRVMLTLGWSDEVLH